MRKAVEETIALLQSQIEPREVHRAFPITWIAGDEIEIEGVRIRSRNLTRNLRGTAEVVLMAATIGLAPDRLYARYNAQHRLSDAAVVQAVGAALVEEWCDEVNQRIREEVLARGRFVRPRFSPGYGDFSLSFQTEFFRILAVQKTIGVTLTDSLLMVPSKSVTAVIGLAETDTSCIMSGCENCDRAAECRYSRFLIV